MGKRAYNCGTGCWTQSGVIECRQWEEEKYREQENDRMISLRLECSFLLWCCLKSLIDRSKRNCLFALFRMADSINVKIGYASKSDNIHREFFHFVMFIIYFILFIYIANILLYLFIHYVIFQWSIISIVGNRPLNGSLNVALSSLFRCIEICVYPTKWLVSDIEQFIGTPFPTRFRVRHIYPLIYYINHRFIYICIYIDMCRPHLFLVS